MPLSTQSALSRFSRRVAASRDVFFRGLKTLPPAIAASATDNYRDRLRRGSGKPLLGEYAPWLLADLLPMRQRGVAGRIAPAWMQLYASTLLTDDILDKPPGLMKAPTLLASALLLERGLSDILQLIPKQANVRLKLDRFFIEAAGATLTEIQRHRARLEDYTDEDVAALGEKVSLLKLCAACLLAVDGNIAAEEELLVPVGLLATAAQLLDDVTDWEEDWRDGNYTFLLSITFKRLHKLGIPQSLEPAKFTAPEVLVGIILTGSLEECLSRGLEYLEKVALSPHLRHASPAAQLIQAMIHENTLFLVEVTKVRQSLERTRQRLTFERTNWLNVLVRQPHVKRRIGSVKRRLRIVAQNT